MAQEGEKMNPDNQLPASVKNIHKNEQMLGTVLLVLILFFILASIVGIGFVVYSQWKYAHDQKNKPAIETLNEPAPAPEETTPAPAAEEPKPAEQTTTVDITKEEVSVMNGGGTPGSAAKLQDALKKEGLTNVKLGNTTGDFSGVVVYYAQDKQQQADALLALVKKQYDKAETKPQDATKKESATSPLTVIIGSGS